MSSGSPHRAAVFVSGSARTQLKRRLIASWDESKVWKPIWLQFLKPIEGQ